MSDGSTTRDTKNPDAKTLAAAFDQAFVAPAEKEQEAGEGFVAFRIDTERHAIRLTEISGVAYERKIVPLPSRHPAMLGLIGVRGALIPVYDLAQLVGQNGIGQKSATQKNDGGKKWFILTGGDEPLAFVVQDFDGYFRVAQNRVTQNIVQTPDGALALLGIGSLQRAIKDN